MKCPLAPKAEQLFFPGNCTSEICTVFRVELKKKKPLFKQKGKSKESSDLLFTSYFLEEEEDWGEEKSQR